MADEVEEVEEETGPRSQFWKHEAMVEWINETEGVDLDTMSAADVIAYAFAKRVSWRHSDTYAELVESHRAEAEEARAERAAEREAAKAAKAEEREAAKAAKEAAEAAKSDGKTTAKATKATKATTAKATTAKATRATAKRPAKAAAAADPFG